MALYLRTGSHILPVAAVLDAAIAVPAGTEVVGSHGTGVVVVIAVAP